MCMSFAHDRPGQGERGRGGGAQCINNGYFSDYVGYPVPPALAIHSAQDTPADLTSTRGKPVPSATLTDSGPSSQTDANGTVSQLRRVSLNNGPPQGAPHPPAANPVVSAYVSAPMSSPSAPVGGSSGGFRQPVGVPADIIPPPPPYPYQNAAPLVAARAAGGGQFQYYVQRPEKQPSRLEMEIDALVANYKLVGLRVGADLGGGKRLTDLMTF